MHTTLCQGIRLVYLRLNFISFRHHLWFFLIHDTTIPCSWPSCSCNNVTQWGAENAVAERVVGCQLFTICSVPFIFYMQYDIYFTIQYDNMIFITLCPHYLLLYEHVNVRFMPFAKLPLWPRVIGVISRLRCPAGWDLLLCGQRGGVLGWAGFRRRSRGSGAWADC